MVCFLCLIPLWVSSDSLWCSWFVKSWSTWRANRIEYLIYFNRRSLGDLYTQRFWKHCPRGSKERDYSLLEIVLSFEGYVVTSLCQFLSRGLIMPSNPAESSLSMSTMWGTDILHSVSRQNRDKYWIMCKCHKLWQKMEGRRLEGSVSKSLT